MRIWTSLVKIWTLCNCEFNENVLTFWDLYHLLFYLESIGFWWLIFEKRPFQFWQKIWIQVVVILLQLYPALILIISTVLTHTIFIHSWILGAEISRTLLRRNVFQKVDWKNTNLFIIAQVRQFNMYNIKPQWHFGRYIPITIKKVCIT